MPRPPLPGALAALFLALLAALTAPRPAQAFTYDGGTLETYPVGGDRAAVAAQMAADGAARDGHFANTHWRIAYHFTTRRQNGVCAIDQVDVTLTTRMRLPQLDAGGMTTTDVRHRWPRFEAALRGHEQGHADIARAGAAAVESRLRQAAPRADCQTLKQDAKLDADRAIAEAKQRQEAYDADTRHGRTQGAVFP